jgi:uncharacterized integral membrane protein
MEQEDTMTEPTTHPSPRSTAVWQNPRVVGGAAGALLFLIFVLQNAASVEVEFLFWGFSMRLIVLMILCAVVGAGIWELGKYLWRRRKTLGV